MSSEGKPTATVVLASASAARARLLRAAGLPIQVDPAAIDEDEIKASLRQAGATAAQLAETLAELKAMRISRRHPGALVVGADQVLQQGDVLFDKPADIAAARRQLTALRGQDHDLVSAVVVVRDGVRLWQHIGQARLTMRDFSELFLDQYLSNAGGAVLGSVGAYQFEGLGIQLFRRVDGDYFTILGLPLLPLLDFLREQGVVSS
ncbi:MAG: Maf family protein [Dongiaceae bacterium]